MNRFRLVGVILAAMLVLPMALFWAAAGPESIVRAESQATIESKIDADVMKQLQAQGSADFLVVLREQADLSGAERLGTKREKGRFVFNAVRGVAARAQPAVRAALDAMGVTYQSFYVVNMFAVESGDRNAVMALAARSDVDRIESDAPRRLVPAMPATDRRTARPDVVEWGVQKIGAPAVWEKGFTGQGVVYANQDTGVQWDHPALKEHYRGWDGDSARHNYNWWDAILRDINGNGTNPCGFRSKVPCDDHNHGTHTTGTGVGDDGGTNQIGVAPGAKFIACRNMDEGIGRPSTYTTCFEFFLAPWDGRKENPKPDLAADVVSNSWGCPIGDPPGGEKCTARSMRDTVKTVRAAGILIAASAGNSGPGCSTVNAPIATHGAVTSIGATDINDNLAVFSSRGPVTVDGSNRRKPDISAPGVGVRSAIRGGGYAVFSGTSMASPHVAGAVALLISARPGLRGNVDRLERLLFITAEPDVNATGVCGGTDPDDIPNNLFGYGRVDVNAAVERALSGR